MAIRDQFLTTEEMLEIQQICNRLTHLSRELEGLRYVAVSILEDPDGGGKSFPVRDTNGEVLGHVGYGDSGFVLYFDDGTEDVRL